MSFASAVLDSNVIIWGATPKEFVPEDRLVDWQRILQTLQWAEGEVDQFIIPAPVIAEIASAPSGPDELAAVFRAAYACRIDALDEEAAVIVGAMLRARWSRGGGPKIPKPVLKFDALIAGIAHSVNATYLITGDTKRNTFENLLADIGSPVEVIRATQLPPEYQLPLKFDF